MKYCSKSSIPRRERHEPGRKKVASCVCVCGMLIMSNCLSVWESTSLKIIEPRTTSDTLRDPICFVSLVSCTTRWPIKDNYEKKKVSAFLFFFDQLIWSTPLPLPLIFVRRLEIHQIDWIDSVVSAASVPSTIGRLMEGRG